MLFNQLVCIGRNINYVETEFPFVTVDYVGPVVSVNVNFVFSYSVTAVNTSHTDAQHTTGILYATFLCLK